MARRSPPPKRPTRTPLACPGKQRHVPGKTSPDTNSRRHGSLNPDACPQLRLPDPNKAPFVGIVAVLGLVLFDPTARIAQDDNAPDFGVRERYRFAIERHVCRALRRFHLTNSHRELGRFLASVDGPGSARTRICSESLSDCSAGQDDSSLTMALILASPFGPTSSVHAASGLAATGSVRTILTTSRPSTGNASESPIPSERTFATVGHRTFRRRACPTCPPRDGLQPARPSLEFSHSSP
jgi:hypothetical protein